ncbi:phytanoyl-CoA dioxygenase family protein [Rhizobium laguerreae]|uniref:Phytanoyl-CoA dioxygenase family protein n=1 Tax=Rhizobium laguerreae TaxID=1076926 RepID=A0AB35F790_9HYPH|nr:phytanoyl-CoA dioxygenase family protein [Rhizobium laguerreae]MBY3062533.1 phytanoyl-CoA dioxygenase family protein [Rhizobium laguerreae]MBY3077085.1 phytanoyl-CoA dioxygenase family protein [Rhizobium laguerreae]MBY3112575.1 phytanoyl-CoA dioxygenase family protein [Rhizobium laguerreae]MBY3138658.1 phytanoyl-CoA dioxygenase family protein [Rhizobium laguerreae]MBY3201646.1 phytanoyl-CoA dioxygenase family protein [Rhizobium laguerreae]
MTNANAKITNSQRADFGTKGYLVMRGFYDPTADIAPIQEGIRQILELICRKHGVDAPTETTHDAMTIAYPKLIAKNRAWGGEVYDAIKQIPAFMRLVTNITNDEAFKVLRPDSVPGIAAGGYGIRIDNPGEEKFRAQWHQEFPGQLRSVDGVVFWTPLLPVTQDMGPVQIAEGSHAEGLVPVYEDDAGAGKTGAYALHLDRAEERLSRYKHVAPLTNPGDLVLMDFLTLHQSGHNVSTTPRWSIQFRYFNYLEPVGIRIGWKGSFAAGVKFADVLPELSVQREAAE